MRDHRQRRVLLVRHTYGSRGWDLPGGSMKRGEAPVNAARREMHEELGVTIDDWRSLGLVSLNSTIAATGCTASRPR